MIFDDIWMIDYHILMIDSLIFHGTLTINDDSLMMNGDILMTDDDT